MEQNKLLARVRKLIALSEDPGATPAEAQLAWDTAQALMIEHDISQAQLTPEERAKIETVMIDMGKSTADRDLWRFVAATRDMRTFYYAGTSRGALIGFADDIAYVQTLVTSLLLQRERYLRTALEGGERGYWENARSWNNTFRVSFATQIYRRLMAAKARTVQETGGTSTALVLASKKSQVDAYCDATHNIRKVKSAPLKANGGARAGVSAANRASLAGGNNQVGADSGRALGR
jgi:hypothetical protein